VNPRRRKLLWFFIGVVLVYEMVCADVVLRARYAYLEGEKASNPREAYAWDETAATLFTPPESRWSRLAREKMPAAKEKWKADLQAKGVPFDDAMLQ